MNLYKIAQALSLDLVSKLKDKGLWLYCDFYITPGSRIWQKAVLRLMYYFFRISCNIEATKLPEIEHYFVPYRVLEEKTYCKKFITGKVFKKGE